MILLIDNYDSFSYNLYQLIGSINPDIKVIRNDEMTVDEIEKLAPEYIVLSPGPKRPEDTGVCIEVTKRLGKVSKILGVCLGHQSICTAFGATVSYAKELMHCKQSICTFDTSSKLFKGLDERIPVARYHSLSVVGETIPDCLKVTAKTDDGEIMAVEHRELPIYGLQFHPESIMTPDGIKILQNFLEEDSND
ncbi:MAG: aminodeoxychorismate/anthranilate synthase component II [Clostridiales bacterium]|nr:aminodeoxychorismate/anthranilate synthase component II [Clostridiales bacterium]